MKREFVYLGVTHHTAALADRERLRCDHGARWQLLESLGDLADQRFVLETCERFEVYGYAAKSQRDVWVARLADHFDVCADVLSKSAQWLQGWGAAEHLIRVACGLESRILGERQILGQVRSAYLEAVEFGCLGPEIHTLCRAAIHAGKRVRHETSLGCKAASSARLAVARLAPSVPVSEPVGVLGTGRQAADVLAELRRSGRRNVILIGRNPERANHLAVRMGMQSCSIHALVEATARCRALFACTSSASYLIDPSVVGDRTDRPLFVLDLGVPRNVDPSIAESHDVALMHLDELMPDADRSVDAANDAECIAIHEKLRLIHWCAERPAVGRISRLFDAVRTQEFGAPSTAQALHSRIMFLKRCSAA